MFLKNKMGCLKISYGEKNCTGLKVVYSALYENENTCTGAYRYGFNGKEKDDEIAEGIYTAEYWEYDSRIGRRWNTDPVLKDWESPYSCFNGNMEFKRKMNSELVILKEGKIVKINP